MASQCNNIQQNPVNRFLETQNTSDSLPELDADTMSFLGSMTTDLALPQDYSDNHLQSAPASQSLTSYLPPPLGGARDGLTLFERREILRHAGCPLSHAFAQQTESAIGNYRFFLPPRLHEVLQNKTQELSARATIHTVSGSSIDFNWCIASIDALMRNTPRECSPWLVHTLKSFGSTSPLDGLSFDLIPMPSTPQTQQAFHAACTLAMLEHLWRV